MSEIVILRHKHNILDFECKIHTILYFSLTALCVGFEVDAESYVWQGVAMRLLAQISRK